MTAFIFFGYPFLLVLMHLPGAYIRTFPSFPDLWYGFWVTLIAVPCTIACSLPVLFECPHVIRQRMSKLAASKEESVAKQRFHKLTSLFWFGAMVVTSYDASRPDNDFPKVYNWLGLASLAASMLWIVWVLRTNKFASRVMHVQPGQQLVTTGPYAVVRHPMYMAIMPCFAGFPIAVGSFWGVLPMCLCTAMIAIRTYDEEEFLVNTFGREYHDYRKEVPYKMIPFLF
jgi:protein-S-isoprenylcysteine O-methyltransferase Ste14